MANLVLFDNLLLLTTTLVHYHHQVEAAVVLQHGRRHTRLQVRHHRRHQRRQLAFRAPAHITTLKGVAGVGFGNSHFPEIPAIQDLLAQVIRQVTGLAHRRLVTRLVYLDKDIGQAVFSTIAAGTGLGLQVVFHFVIGNAHPVAHLALLHPTGKHLVADLLPRLLVGHTFFRQLAFELGHGHAIAAGDIGQGFVQLVIADAHAHFVRHLQLDGFSNQLFQYPLLQHLAWWQAGTLGTQPAHNGVHPGFQLGLQDDIVVDNGDHPVQQLAFSLYRQRHGHHGHGQQQGQSVAYSRLHSHLLVCAFRVVSQARPG